MLTCPHHNGLPITRTLFACSFNYECEHMVSELGVHQLGSRPLFRIPRWTVHPCRSEAAQPCGEGLMGETFCCVGSRSEASFSAITDVICLSETPVTWRVCATPPPATSHVNNSPWRARAHLHARTLSVHLGTQLRRACVSCFVFLTGEEA